MFSDSIDLVTLEKAWYRLARWSRDTYPFFDRVAVDEFDARLSQELLAILSQLKSDQYEFSPFNSITIPKPNDTERLIAVPSLRDGLVAQVVFDYAAPLIERDRPTESCAYQLPLDRTKPETIFVNWAKHTVILLQP